MNRVEANRMARMVSVLEVLPRKVYDQSLFAGWDGPPRLDADGQPRDCGTSACFAGWVVAAFPRQWRWVLDVPYLRSHRRGVESGIADFFGISCDEAFELVRGDSSANTPKRKAKQLRALLDAYGWEVVEEEREAARG